MNIYDIIELVKLTEQRGQELLIDSLIIGIEIGRSNLTMKEISELALQLKNLKILIDSNVCSPFKRDEIFDNYLNQNQNSKLHVLLDDLQLPLKRQSLLKGQACLICETEVFNEHKWDNLNCSYNHLLHQNCAEPLLNENKTCPICDQLPLKIKTPQSTMSCCPSIKCQEKFQYIGQEMYRCFGCKRKFCLKCRSEYHYPKNCATKQEEFQVGQRFKECRDCKQWVEILETDVQFIKCFCKREFCFKCGEDPQSCQCIRQAIQQQGIFSTLRNIFRLQKQ